MSFTVSANVWSEQYYDYTGDHWVAGVFDSYEEAYKVWDEWMPPREELIEACHNDWKPGMSDHYEVEVAIWDENGDLAEEDFYNETINWRQ